MSMSSHYDSYRGSKHDKRDRYDKEEEFLPEDYRAHIELTE
jgi:hypothetical protein